MIKEITAIIRTSANTRTEGDILYCEHTVQDANLLERLYEAALLHNSGIEDLRPGDIVILEFSFAALFSQGIYENRASFLRKHYYRHPSRDIFICETGSYFTDDHIFHTAYTVVVRFMEALAGLAQFSYFEEELRKLLLVREDVSLLLPLHYTCADLSALKATTLEQLQDVTVLFSGNAFPDRQGLFINELIHYLQQEPEAQRFSFLLQHFGQYYTRATSAYTYYLRNFSYNKLRLEMDAKALDFSQRLQGVVNDIQNKLIVIPSAFVLVITTFIVNRNRLFYVNIFSFAGFLIFCAYFQIFIANQRSLLRIIKSHIDKYLGTFREAAFEELKASFSLVYEEHRNQSFRLLLVNMILVLSLVLSITFLICLRGNENFYS